jgi:hypothetical protein
MRTCIVEGFGYDYLICEWFIGEGHLAGKVSRVTKETD